MSEVWKDVIGYEGFYQVSNMGNVKRVGKGLAVVTNRLLKNRRTNDGYIKVKLCVHQKARLVSVHVLVAEAFICPRPAGKQVNHKNGKTDQNNPENLEWATPSENLQHSYDVLGRLPPQGEKHGNAKLTDVDIREIRRLHALHTGYHAFENSYTDLAERYGVTRGLIGHIVRRANWKHVN